MLYRSEQIMSQDFEKFLNKRFGKTYYKEWEGLFGIPDYVCFDKTKDGILVVSYELKLTNWKTALVQAYRYRSFSDYSYVVLPADTVKRAEAHIDFFKQYGIGLVAFYNDTYQVKLKAMLNKPYSPDLREKAIHRVKKSRKKSFGSLADLLI